MFFLSTLSGFQCFLFDEILVSDSCPCARILEKARVQLQEDIIRIQSQLLEEKKKREQHEALVRRLQKRVLLLTKTCAGLANRIQVFADETKDKSVFKERDGMRAILESYDSELTPSEHSPQLNRRMREAEDMVQKLHAHNTELEAQLSQVLEEVGNHKQRAEMLEVEMKVLKSQECTAEQSTIITKEEIDTLRQKIEELEAERSKLEEQNRSLEMKLEKLTVQGDYDPSKTKVLHFSMNPASLAMQQRKEEHQQLQEAYERLKEMVRVLEGGGSIPENLEGLGSLQSSQEIAVPCYIILTSGHQLEWERTVAEPSRVGNTSVSFIKVTGGPFAFSECLDGRMLLRGEEITPYRYLDQKR
ncbi:mitotic spindle assembly checkpoint protein MAD1 [Amazona aestiva]|uniref:Mitotic spindle assembly checkpoint protein MAD1 n=1 Tax=Amazona aestiva TaxID=12930 RepID=A0A0Q3XBL3_AMAAE|nr:mitotic spindle assembly checkpoint protein MAD1 [Amazona aestiva]